MMHKLIPMFINDQVLQANRACQGERKHFNRIFPARGRKVTLRNLRIASKAGLPVGWLVGFVDRHPLFKEWETSLAKADSPWVQCSLRIPDCHCIGTFTPEADPSYCADPPLGVFQILTAFNAFVTAHNEKEAQTS